ncbi:response regulator [Candidatus Venteria ishoeyi]|uniref:Response regulator MprA n=1 Tax=Candidatus Venteria ishoeyi TaxID=1899563 RepID=A0A1H6F6T7_9GAMM|nr:response regulator [Candidatus Venteria ishoeyi]MDM8547965.1 response regulator [Candidatus Venteria ishoeyi]SEH05121.1 Response regulator MprA [Candidatus Venteria ishoeyi]
MKHEYLPSAELIRSLISICDKDKTGTMFVVSDNHSIQIRVDQGKIIGANAGNHHGLSVLKTIKELAKVRFSFSEGLLMPQHEPSFFDQPGIKSNDDIFAQLDVKLTDFNITEEKKVLIIDDSKIARRVARETLLKCNYRVIEAANGVQGLEKIAKEKPALILLDIVMPKMDGYEVLSLIRATKRYKNIPIIMLTSRDTLFDKLKGKMSDANEYITKPFVAEELVSKVSHYLN